VTRRLGRYQLLTCLGKGGGGEVWEAELQGPSGFRRRVAVKLLPPGAGATAADDLVHEARLGALVAHPHVVSTLELGRDAGRWFLVMNLVRGCSVEQLRRRGPLPPAAVLDIGVQACAGLAHIHALTDHDGWPLGLVHRDIKPGNLMVDTDHRVRIVDLGIARLQGTEQVPSGTPGYIAPEQLRGEEGPRADVFSLGVTLTRLATGRRVFGRGSTAMRRVLGPEADAFATSPALLAELDAYLEGLGAVLSRAMRADPEDRWPTATAMGDALHGLYAHCDRSQGLATLPVSPPSGPNVTPGGLTTERGSFVGRGQEQTALHDLLHQGVRWVVLVGPGGVGKTRVLDEQMRATDHVRVDVSRARTLAGVCLAVADALGVAVGDDPVATVGRELRSVERLVLDEIEQAVDAATQAISSWLQAVPGLTVVCSSRVAPGHPDATLVRIGPLPMDDARDLFTARLGREAPATIVDPLLRTLDRLPLAIELAAARARRTSPKQVLAQLQATSSARVPGVREALQASWELLASVDQQALVRLAAFEGAFGLRDATAVLGPEADPLARVEALVTHSLLHVRANRFRLLTSVRAFAREQLPETRQAGEVHHGRWLARHGDRTTVFHAARCWATARTLVRSLDDLIAASRRAVRRGDGEVAAATTMAAYTAMRPMGLVGEALPLIDQALPLGHRTALLHFTRASALHDLGDNDAAHASLQTAWSLAEGVDRWHVQGVLGLVRSNLGDPAGVRLAEEAFAALDGSRWIDQRITVQESLALVYTNTGRVAEAERHLSEAIRATERHGRDSADLLTLLAMVHRQRGQLRRSIDCIERALEQYHVHRHVWHQLFARAILASHLYLRGCRQPARATAEACAATAEDLDAPYARGLALGTLFQLAFDRSDPDEAQRIAAQQRQVAHARQHPVLLRAAARASAQLDGAVGRHDRAAAHLEPLLSGPHLNHLYEARTLSLFARFGPPERAELLLDTFEAKLSPEQIYERLLLNLARAEAAHRRGDARRGRGALLQASVEADRTDLLPEAPLRQQLDRLRAELAP